MNVTAIRIAVVVSVVASGATIGLWPISAVAERESQKENAAKKEAEPLEFVSPDFKTTDKVAGIWTLNGETILKHDLRVCGIDKVSKELEKELMPLATKLGSQYTLIITSDGKWQFHSKLDGNIFPLEDEIFAKLTGKEVSKEYNYEEWSKRFPNDPKRPLGGSWRWSKTEGFTHFGFKERYRIRSPGKIVAGEGTLTLKDAKSGDALGFTFVGKYRHDPDPRFRGKRGDETKDRS